MPSLALYLACTLRLIAHFAYFQNSLKEQLEGLLKQNSDLAPAHNTTDTEIQRLQRRISLYERNFGLEMRRTKAHNNIQVIMRGCCEDDCNLPSYIILRFNSDSTQMELVKCNPPVADIDKLIGHFNKVGDFHSFLLILRSRFVKYFQLRKTHKQKT